MTLYVITCEERATDHDYKPLYAQLEKWGAAQMQNSVWLLNTNFFPEQIRNAARSLMHENDSVFVITVFKNSAWSSVNVRRTGDDWLKENIP
jgi:hypothetical protein